MDSLIILGHKCSARDTNDKERMGFVEGLLGDPLKEQGVEALFWEQSARLSPPEQGAETLFI